MAMSPLEGSKIIILMPWRIFFSCIRIPRVGERIKEALFWRVIFQIYLGVNKMQSKVVQKLIGLIEEMVDDQN